MTTKTREKVTKAIESYAVCDICGDEIVTTVDTCKMCHRDVHSAAGHPDCSTYDDEREGLVCSVCWALGTAHRHTVERCAEQLDKSLEKWQDKCDEHRYDAPKKKREKKKGT